MLQFSETIRSCTCLHIRRFLRSAADHLLVEGDSWLVPSSSLESRSMKKQIISTPTSRLLRQQPVRTLRSQLLIASRSFAAASASPASVIDGQWLGSDAFTQLNDRVDAAPLPLPSISRPVRVCLVRHGQSTWNAEGRIQGSSDLSVLSPKGVIQAEAAQSMLAELPFTNMFHSPLARATQTANTICEGRQIPSTQLPALREVDLYGFQGLIKADGKSRYGSQYLQWQRQPAEFEIDGHAPVRELWYRASLAWQQVLAQATLTSTQQQQQQQQRQEPGSGTSTPNIQLKESTVTDPTDDLILVVAHNAVNQAMICTALGLGPQSFRAITQANAAVTMLQLTPAGQRTNSAGVMARCAVLDEGEEDVHTTLGGVEVGSTGTVVSGSTGVQMLCLNQTNAEVLKVEDGLSAHIILMCCDERSDSTSPALVTRLAKLLSSTQVHAIVGPAIHHHTAQQLQQLLPSPAPFTTLQSSAARATSPISNNHLDSSSGSSAGATERETSGRTWTEICSMAAKLGGQNLVVLLDAASASNLICDALKLPRVPTNQLMTAAGHGNQMTQGSAENQIGCGDDVGHQEERLLMHPFIMLSGTIAVINFSGDPVSTPAVLHSILAPGLDF